MFKDRFYNGEDYIFVHGNNRLRYICLLRDDGNEVDVHGSEWTAFVKDNIPGIVRSLHFVKEAVGTFYVTGYDINGVEGPGYKRRGVGNKVARCLVRRTAEGQVSIGLYRLLYYTQKTFMEKNKVSILKK